ncbi:MAG: sodium:calcium antiporter, partial [Dehalococcoidia bacterium]|nr:sodium:calcium antiporter [Dehalococcoidia bacterium]
MWVTIGLLFGSLLLILFAAELFTNSIEWAGHKLRFSEGVVGSVLAAVGTAMPETIIPVVAVWFGSGGQHSSDIGIGAILGAPFMLATLAMFVTGTAVFAYKKRRGG